MVHDVSSSLTMSEIEIASGSINKVSARAASVQLEGNAIISVLG